MSGLETLTWTVARAGGLTAYALLSLSVVLGLALSVRWQAPRWPRLITNDLHRFLTLLSLVFVVVHGLAVWLDPFTSFNWNEVLVPLLSHYRPLWMALGIVAAYLGAAIWISTELRPYIGYTWWRRLHALTFAVYVLSTLHGIATGSDTRTPWALALYAGSAALIGLLLVYRLLTPIGRRARAYPNLAWLVMLVVAGGAVWTATGPAQPGWNAVANNGQGNGGRGPHTATAAAQSAGAGTLAAPFTAALQGTLTQGADGASGGVVVTIAATLSRGLQGSFQIVLHGMPADDGSVTVTSNQMSLLGPGGARYQGALQALQSDGEGWNVRALLRGQGTRSVLVQGAFQMMPGGQISGTLQGAPA